MKSGTRIGVKLYHKVFGAMGDGTPKRTNGRQRGFFSRS